MENKKILFSLEPFLIFIFLFLLKPHCCKLLRHVSSNQDQVFFTFSQGFSLPCRVSTCAYRLSRA